MGWKDELYKYDITIAEDLDRLANKSTEAKENDIGFVNPSNGTGILARENGDLEGFADYGLGFRFSRKNQSLLVFAPSIHVFTKKISTHDGIAKQSYFQDEYKNVEDILKNIQL